MTLKFSYSVGTNWMLTKNSSGFIRVELQWFWCQINIFSEKLALYSNKINIIQKSASKWLWKTIFSRSYSYNNFLQAIVDAFVIHSGQIPGSVWLFNNYWKYNCCGNVKILKRLHQPHIRLSWNSYNPNIIFSSSFCRNCSIYNYNRVRVLEIGVKA